VGLVGLLLAVLAYTTRAHALHPALVQATPWLATRFGPYDVAVERIAGDWFRTLELHGLRVRGAVGGTTFDVEVELLRVRGNLLAAALGRAGAVASVDVVAPVGTIAFTDGDEEDGADELAWLDPDVLSALPLLRLERGELRLAWDGADVRLQELVCQSEAVSGERSWRVSGRASGTPGTADVEASLTVTPEGAARLACDVGGTLDVARTSGNWDGHAELQLAPGERVPVGRLTVASHDLVWSPPGEVPSFAAARIETAALLGAEDVELTANVVVPERGGATARATLGAPLDLAMLVRDGAGPTPRRTRHGAHRRAQRRPRMARAARARPAPRRGKARAGRRPRRLAESSGAEWASHVARRPCALRRLAGGRRPDIACRRHAARSANRGGASAARCGAGECDRLHSVGRGRARAGRGVPGAKRPPPALPATRVCARTSTSP
jgi:hypothetical protein